MRRPKALLVTGGAGFIGSAFIRHVLEAGFSGQIVNLDALTYAGNLENLATVAEDPRYRFVHGNINDGALVGRLLSEHGIEAVVHFAAESHVDRSIGSPEAFMETNVMGTFRILEAVRGTSTHFHHVSTDEVFGSLGSIGTFSESSPYRPNSPYSASKAASDHLVRAYARTYGLSVTLSNSSNNYGPGQHPEKLVPHMISKLLVRESLPVYGDGSHVRDWLYVDDHVEAIWRIVLNGPAGESYNVGGDEERSNLEMVRALIANVQEETGSTELEGLIGSVPDRPGHDQRYAIDSSKIRSKLGWAPRFNLTSGLRETVRWYLSRSAVSSFGRKTHRP